MKEMKSVLAALVAVTVACALSAPVERDVALKAADGFISRDSIGSAILGGRVIDEITKRGELWIVALQPSGHIILSASDYAAPIVAFSENDFTEPDPESPAYAILEAASENIRRIEEEGGAERNSQWDSLLKPATNTKMKGLLGAGVTDGTGKTIIIPPFLTTHFDQGEPYNDFSPVCVVATNNANHGRSPCGCIATTAATIAHHFRWPARIDETVFYDKDSGGAGNFIDANGEQKSFPIRFDGHVPIDWNAVDAAFSNPTYVTNILERFPDGRYTYHSWIEYCDEAARFPVAKTILFMDVLAKMSFKPNESLSNYETVANGLSDWYTVGVASNLTESTDAVLNLLSNKVPCQLSVNNGPSSTGHSVIIHGWAQNASGTKFAYLNCGWGGSNEGRGADGYYNISDSITLQRTSYQQKKVWLNHIPRAKPQINPLPKVCGRDFTVSWSFPDIHTNKLEGFIVTWIRPKKRSITDFIDTFSATTGTSSSSEIYVLASHENWNDGALLYLDYVAKGTFSYSTAHTLTSASVLTLDISSFAAITATLELQMKLNGGEWETIANADIEGGRRNSRQTIRVFLGENGGKNAQFRLKKDWGGSYYTDDAGNPLNDGYVIVDNFKITNTQEQENPENRDVGPTERSRDLKGFYTSGDCTFTVKPKLSTDAIVSGEMSSPVTISCAGEHITAEPGYESFQSSSTTNLSFSTTDKSGVWSYSYEYTNGVEEVKGIWGCSLSADIYGKVMENSRMTFSWKANNYYGGGSFDTFTAVFVDDSGDTKTLWTTNNTSEKTTYQSVNISLGEYTGKSGKIVISFFHNGQNYPGGNYTGNIKSPQITNIMMPTVPAVTWKTETLLNRGTPEILSVEAIEDGLYKECGTNATTFKVTCSQDVVKLEAHPSHLALVRDEDVGIEKLGNGEFNVTITPSGVNESNYRSRMILTLEATDSNGTKTYKDLSLRFEKVEPSGGEGTDVITINEGEESQPININFSWFKDAGLTNVSNIAASEMKSVLSLLAKEDSDGDGISNWQEYVCGTSPTNETDKIICDIKIVNGQPKVTAVNTNSVISGYKATIKARAKLDATSSWVDKSENPTGPFFKVVIEQE